MQVILIKYTDNKNMKARMMLSDGCYIGMAIISQEVFDKIEVIILALRYRLVRYASMTSSKLKIVQQSR